jgi:hypothetical protein
MKLLPQKRFRQMVRENIMTMTGWNVENGDKKASSNQSLTQPAVTFSV